MKSSEIVLYLDKIIPNPKCELEYDKDYELLIATMLSAQTTDKRVNMVTRILFKKYPSLETLNEASLDDLIEIIKPVGTFNKKAINIKMIVKDLLEKSEGKVPNDRIFLESLSGVGRKTANVVLSNLYDIPVIAVDTHVKRTSIRLNLADKDDDVNTIEEKLTKKFKKKQLLRLHHQLVLFGRYHCKAKNPNCDICKLKDMCNKNKSEK